MKYFCKKKSRRNLYYGLLLLIAFFLTFCIYYSNNVTMISLHERPLVNPPMYIRNESRRILYKLKNVVAISNNSVTKKSATDQLFEVLSSIVQDQISKLHQQSDCSQTNIVCCHQDAFGCGLGCQIHRRTACLIVSYALGVPLIHDDSEGWPYTHKWSSIFLPLGSQCKIGPLTYRLKWMMSPYPILYKESVFSSISPIGNGLEYPLKDGIPVSRVIADIVELIHKKLFL